MQNIMHLKVVVEILSHSMVTDFAVGVKSLAYHAIAALIFFTIADIQLLKTPLRLALFVKYIARADKSFTAIILIMRTGFAIHATSRLFIIGTRS